MNTVLEWRSRRIIAGSAVLNEVRRVMGGKVSTPGPSSILLFFKKSPESSLTRSIEPQMCTNVTFRQVTQIIIPHFLLRE